jgi:hypothetical protein
MVEEKRQIVPQATGRTAGGDHPVGNEESRINDLFFTIDFYAVVVSAKQHAHESWKDVMFYGLPKSIGSSA